MFPKSLASKLHGPSLGLLTVLGVCLALNLGALIFSLRILTRGMQGYSASCSSHPVPN